MGKLADALHRKNSPTQIGEFFMNHIQSLSFERTVFIMTLNESYHR